MKALVKLVLGLSLLLTPGAAFAQSGFISGSGGGGGSGTVTSVATSCGASGGPITTTGTISSLLAQNVVATATPALDGYCGQQVNLSYSAGAKTPTLAAATANGAGWWTIVCNIAANTATIAPVSGTIGGAATYVLAAGTAAAPSCVQIAADVTNTDYKLSFVPSTAAAPTSLLATAAQPSFSGNNQTTIGAGTATYSGSNLPANTGIFAIGGTYGAGGEPASSADGNAWIGLSTGKGLELGGRGSVGDISFFNANGSLTCYFPHNFGGIDCANFRVDNAIQISDAGSTYYPLIYAPNTNTGGGTTVAASGPFGSSAPTPVGMSTAAFQITVGASPSGTDGTMTFSQAAKTGWACDAWDITTTTVTIKMNTTSRSTTVLHFTFSATPTAGDVLVFKCMSY